MRKKEKQEVREMKERGREDTKGMGRRQREKKEKRGSGDTKIRGEKREGQKDDKRICLLGGGGGRGARLN